MNGLRSEFLRFALITAMGFLFTAVIMPVGYYVPIPMFYMLNILKFASATVAAVVWLRSSVLVSACLALASESLFLFIASWFLSPHMGAMQGALIITCSFFFCVAGLYISRCLHSNARVATAVAGGIFAVLTSAWFSAWHMDWQYWLVRSGGVLLPPILTAVLPFSRFPKRLAVAYMIVEPILLVLALCVLEASVELGIVFMVFLIVHLILIGVPAAIAAAFSFMIGSGAQLLVQPDASSGSR